uniref:Uncharacterized protein n=1 Tax=Rhizophagus irregularis (strain DAOM 181602 / DAOM 197198 / MUCL 43194) TaxID=747089 RepID=U9UFE3_RHIID
MDNQSVFIHPETLRKRKIRENETHNQRERSCARGIAAVRCSAAADHIGMTEMKYDKTNSERTWSRSGADISRVSMLHNFNLVNLILFLYD